MADVKVKVIVEVDGERVVKEVTKAEVYDRAEIAHLASVVRGTVDALEARAYARIEQ